MKPFVPPLVLACALLGPAPAVRAQPAGDAAPGAPNGGMDPRLHGTTLAIAAEGEVKAAPDMASMSLGVQTQAATASDAMSQNAAQMTRVVDALRRSGVADKDVRTSGVSLNAQYAYEPNKPPRLTGYQASNEVTVTVLDLARLGPALDAVMAAGANQVNGISFGLKDPQAAEDSARLKAVQILQARARLYAGATGLRLGRLINLTEGSALPQPRPLPMLAMRAEAAAAPAIPVEPGQLDIKVDVTAIYELSR